MKYIFIVISFYPLELETVSRRSQHYQATVCVAVVLCLCGCAAIRPLRIGKIAKDRVLGTIAGRRVCSRMCVRACVRVCVCVCVCVPLSPGRYLKLDSIIVYSSCNRHGNELGAQGFQLPS